MAGPNAPHKKELTLQQHKQRVQQRTMKHKPAAPAPVALTNTDIKAAVKGWIDNQLKLWMSRVSATQDAIAQADMMHQNIMNRKATPPIMDALLEKLIVGVAMMTLPELSGAALVFKQMMNEHELRKKAAELIADVTKEGAAEIKKSLDEYKTEEDSANAKSIVMQFFQNLYARVGAMRDRATITNVRLTHYIDVSISSNDPRLQPKLDDVLGVWYDAGLQTEETRRIDSLQLGLLFLYDLMRLYCSQHVKLEAKAGIISSSWELTGLDPAQREAMYRCFEKIKWQDPRRPKIQKWDDLINNWSFRRND